MASRGIRGATTVKANTRQAILTATRDLLQEMVRANVLRPEDVACAFFTTTRDLNAEFPAAGAREMGWTDVPLLCGHEMDVPGSLSRVIRVMLVVNTDKRQDQVAHVYLKEASKLRSWDHKGSQPVKTRSKAS